MRSFLSGLIEAFTRLRSGAQQVSNTRYERQVQQINGQRATLRELSDPDLRQQFVRLRGRIQDGVIVKQVVIEAFAIIREVARRTVGMEPYDVQLLAGLALFDRKMVEMQTGEGKTLAAVLPACLRALSSQGVHILTFNDYLAERDAAWMKPIYSFLDLTVGHVVQGMDFRQRQAGYNCDVTYVTAKEAGFDFLRDQVCTDPERLVHRAFAFAIVDEADSILIDEARVPLVIAGPTDETIPDLDQLADLVRRLRSGRDFDVTDGWRSVSFHPAGLDRIERELGCGDLYEEQNVALLTRLNLALHAQVLLRRDVDYLVRDGAIHLIDELTGRVAENRRWPYGLQAALEAKERLPIRPQGRILNSVTLQHFLQMYAGISGMTGTAREAAEEFQEFYRLMTVVIPPNRPSVRRDLPDQIFATKAAKQRALVQEIQTLHEQGCPVLVGTASVEESEELASLLLQRRCPCQVLNAKNDREEAAIIAEAGSVGAITISTNMAGRGTDIRLGGSDEHDRDRVIQLGGLRVFGTNRYESRRIDNQLRGRAGRQGDPGETRFMISLDDDLIHRHGLGDLVSDLPRQTTTDLQDDPRFAAQIAHVQRVIEGETFEIRRTLRKYSFCPEQQRQTIQERRQRLLRGQEFSSLLAEKQPEIYERLVQDYGETTVRNVERKFAIEQIDRCWSNHLALMAEIRDQIHLMSMAGFNPLDEFNRQVTKAFRETTSRIDRDVVAKMLAFNWRTGIGEDIAAINGPSSTWTYMINDNPMGDFLERLSRRLRHLMKRVSTKA